MNLTHHRIYVCYGCGAGNACIEISNSDPEEDERRDCGDYHPATEDETAEILRRFTDGNR